MKDVLVFKLGDPGPSGERRLTLTCPVGFGRTKAERCWRYVVAEMGADVTHGPSVDETKPGKLEIWGMVKPV